MKILTIKTLTQKPFFNVFKVTIAHPQPTQLQPSPKKQSYNHQTTSFVDLFLLRNHAPVQQSYKPRHNLSFLSPAETTNYNLNIEFFGKIVDYKKMNCF